MNTALSQTNLVCLQEIRGPHVDFSKYFWPLFENPKLTNTVSESDSAQTNTARSFAGINVVFAGPSLPWKRILNL